MSVKQDASGRRSVQVEVEVPGTPEEVWQAIATGPGVSAWFCPTEIEMGADGKPARVLLHMGPGMDSAATVTAWDPPRRFAAESAGWAPNSPPVLTEWSVEARAGGTCIVSVVHSLFASTADWDDQLEGTETGWPGFFRILRLYLTHFRGQQCAAIRVMGFAPEPQSEAWDRLTASLGLAGAKIGERRNAPASAALRLAGVVEGSDQDGHMHTLLLRITEPASGLASLSAFPCGGPVMVAITIYLYGRAAAAAVASDEPLWQAWMQQQFPAPAEASAAAE